VVGDRPEDLRSALEFLAGTGVDLIITSGGLGPTADDLTQQVVADFCGRAVAVDEALEERVWAIVQRLHRRFPRASEEAMRAGARKQALVPAGATILEPVGTAPGLIVPGDGLLVLVLPGPPRELQPMWATAVETEPLRALLAGTGDLERRIIRMYGVPEAELAATLRGVDLQGLEVTTCLRRGELEVSTVFAPAAEAAYDELEDILGGPFHDAIFSYDGATIDEVVARLLAGRTVATAESCTGGLMAGRLTDLAGSSAYVLGGLVVYSNEAKVALAGVPAELIERHGAVSPEVARALAAGARERLDADIGIGITGIAGPGGGTPQKPVGTVCLCVASADAAQELTVRLPGSRADIRDRTTTTAMHMLRSLLGPEVSDAPNSPIVRHVTPTDRPLRLFVALDLPEPVRDALADLAAAADPAVWRPVNRDALHVTLAFLGSRPPGDVDTIEALLPAGSSAIELALAGAEILPPRRGRVLSARIDDPSGALGELQAALSARLDAAGLYTPEKRPFHPHVTVARLRPRTRPPRAVDLPLEPLEFTAEAVTLYVSRLHPKGARYEPLVRAPLAG
jgi:nicotinamide-nucleotide amidase